MPSEKTAILRRADAEFATRLLAVGDDGWNRPTPCADWPVRQLVGHVVAGSAMAAAITRGANRNEAIAILGVDHLAGDAVAAYRRVLDEQAAVFESVDSLDQVCEHPAGDMTVRQLIDLRIGDLVLHAWDLAVALGLDTTLDADLVAHAWGTLLPMEPVIRRLGIFGEGASGTVPDDALLQVRLLDLSGRRPL